MGVASVTLLLCIATSLISLVTSDRLSADRFDNLKTVEFNFENCFLFVKTSKTSTRNAEFRCGVPKGDKFSIEKAGGNRYRIGYNNGWRTCPMVSSSNKGNAEFRCNQDKGDLFEIKADAGNKWTIKYAGCKMIAQKTTNDGKVRNAAFDCNPLTDISGATADLAQLSSTGGIIKRKNSLKGRPVGDGNFIFIWQTGLSYKMIIQDPAKPKARPSLLECAFTTGDGRGSSEIEIGKQKGAECIYACIKRSVTDYSINGVTVMRDNSAGCYCERNMKSVIRSATSYKTCYLRKSVATSGGAPKNSFRWISEGTIFSFSNFKAKNKKNSIISRHQCTFIWGDGDSETEEEIGTQHGNECAKACLRKKERGDASINGATINTRAHECYCEKEMDDIDESSKYKTCFFTPRQDSFVITGDGCKLTKMMIMADEKLAVNEGTEILGIVTAGNCDGFDDSEQKKLQFSKEISVSNSVTLGQSESKEVNWALSVSVGVTTKAGFFGNGVEATYSVEASAGGAVSFENSKEVGTETSSATGKGIELPYTTPGIAMIIGSATTYKIDQQKVPVRQTIQCEGGYSFTYDTTMSMKSQTYGHVHYDTYEGRYFKGECTDARSRTCVRNIEMRSYKTLFDAKDAFKKCLRDKNGRIIGSSNTCASGIPTTGGNAKGECCLFPFTYEGVEYNNCTTTVGHKHPWCYTERRNRWGNCDFDSKKDEAIDALDLDIIDDIISNDITKSETINEKKMNIEDATTINENEKDEKDLKEAREVMDESYEAFEVL